MRDGYTRKLETKGPENPTFEEHLQHWQASLVIVSGGAEGSEYLIQGPQVSLGRGPDVDMAFDDQTLSRQHAAIEFTGTGFRVRDLGSMNGIRVNDSETRVADLKNGDRIQMGELVLQLVLEKREAPPKTYVLPDED